MPDLLGFFSLGIIIFLTLLISLRWPSVSKILFVALFVRIVVLLIGHYLFPLPDAGADAFRFEDRAWGYAQNGFDNILTHYKGPHTYFLSWIISVPYSLFGRSILMAQSISLFFGMGSVFFGWLIAKKLWDDNSAKKAGWFLALFPSLVLYSVLILREVYCSFFLLLAIFGMINWFKTGSLKSFFLIIFGFIAATFFHGALIIGLITFIIILTFRITINISKRLKDLKVTIKTLSICLILTLSYIILINNFINIPKVGRLVNDTGAFGYILEKTNLHYKGEAKYPTWLTPKTEIEILYKSPIRIIYFLFSPFPWDINKPSHLIGMFDGLLYFYLVYKIFCNRKIIWANPVLRFIFLILISYIIVFGVSTGNFGTAIRHRAKFITLFVLLIASSLPKIIFSQKKLKNKKTF